MGYKPFLVIILLTWVFRERGDVYLTIVNSFFLFTYFANKTVILKKRNKRRVVMLKRVTGNASLRKKPAT